MDMYSKEEFEEIINKSSSLKEVLLNLGYKPFTGNYSTLKNKINEFNIDLEPLNNRRKNIKREKHNSNKKDINELLFYGSSTSNKVLKKRLIEENIIDNKCSDCDIEPFWNGKELTFHLDHINGDNKDNSIENLRFLCPNCHSQTNTYCGRNIKEKRKLNCCKFCNKELSNSYSKSELCWDCLIEYKNKFVKGEENLIKPSVGELKELVINLGFTKTGEIYNVSANSVKKWCKKYGIYEDISIEKEKLKYLKNKSCLKFVRFINNKYTVSIWFDNKVNYFGSYETREEAAKVADEKMIELFGPDVLTNKKLGLIDY